MQKYNISVQATKDLLQLLGHASFQASDLPTFYKLSTQRSRVPNHFLGVSICKHHNQEWKVWLRDGMEIVDKIIQDKSVLQQMNFDVNLKSRTEVHVTKTPLYQNGVRVFESFVTGEWMRKTRKAHNLSSDIIMLPFSISSDQTCVTNRMWGGAAGAYPFYLTPLNMRDATLPPPISVVAYLEMPSQAFLNQFKAKDRVGLKNAVYHKALQYIVYPFSQEYQKRNNNGVYIKKIGIDNQLVLVYPTIAQFIHDMMEAWRIKCQYQFRCDWCCKKDEQLQSLEPLPKKNFKEELLAWCNPKLKGNVSNPSWYKAHFRQDVMPGWADLPDYQPFEDASCFMHSVICGPGKSTFKGATNEVAEMVGNMEKAQAEIDKAFRELLQDIRRATVTRFDSPFQC
eukprot:TRINITY_DN7536_c0_g1_i3.p1 TRINITY_DN7536_c0_g1~~TRINITY_DN7536_c0_g1_i3.p1  ORF type:complete len:397 (-),score=55.04 TRINITY_DN7536_c0_g1_i3:1059-2249(-)